MSDSNFADNICRCIDNIIDNNDVEPQDMEQAQLVIGEFRSCLKSCKAVIKLLDIQVKTGIR